MPFPKTLTTNSDKTHKQHRIDANLIWTFDKNIPVKHAQIKRPIKHFIKGWVLIIWQSALWLEILNRILFIVNELNNENAQKKNRIKWNN